MRPACFLLCALVVLASAVISDVAAQGPEEYDAGVAAGPLKLVADVRPGEVWEGSFRMAARAAGTPSTFDLEIWDLAQGLTGHKQAVERGRGARSAAGWIDVESEVRLAPGERRDVPVTVSVPADAFGAYSGYIVLRLRSDEPTEQLATTVVPTIDIEVLVRVQSRGPLEVGVERIELAGAGAGEEPRLSVEIRNSGVWPTEVKGDVLLYPESGLFPHRVELPYRSDGKPYELYPGQQIRLNCAQAPRIPPGKCRAVARLELGQGRESRSEILLDVRGGVPATSEAERRMEIGTDLWIDEQAQEISLPPGAQRSVAVRVSNLGEDPIALKVTVEEARLEASGRWTYAASDIPHPGLTVDASPESLMLDAGANAVVKATVRLEKDATLESIVVKGVRFTGRSAHATSDDWEGVYDAASLIIIEPTGGEAASLEITELELIRPSLSRNPGSVVLAVANRGSGVGAIRGVLTLKRETGELIAEMAMGRKSWERVMPGKLRKFRMPLPIVD
ncbi:hypothetical protein KAW64_16475, partial [bacterium]|nr:hypothetical protein [bacterium]